ncbi:MAG: serine/threonine-protein kinase [Planctomycetaceae bacterium]
MSSSHEDELGRLMDEFLERRRRGEYPSLSEFVQRHPELEDDIRELFPAVARLEQAELSQPAVEGGAMLMPDGSELRRLGDFRIEREIGRGGMGVVYEAIQESLGRTVALKVLVGMAALDSQRRQRFLRESRTAAMLHHSNIVPVFGVGEHNGILFYAMQFIEGRPLDMVLEELRRIREPQLFRPATDSLTRSVAAAFDSVASDADANSNRSSGPGVPPPISVGEEATASEFHLPACTGSADDSRTGSSLTDPTGHGVQYFRNVAQLGSQAADAMAYAHARGVLHRDIKPANLLLDLQGIIWIADFGLARTSDDSLTQPGDLIGTLRYMAPERFHGDSSEQSDIYSLGLTLYELLTLRPAFVETEKAQLTRTVTQTSPPLPRNIDPRIPRDLETIVLKAIAREPASRYRTAVDLAEDLRRFLADRPIVARRTTLRERMWLWCRRSPAVASLVGVVALLLIVLTITSGTAAFRLRRQNVAMNESLTRATAAEASERTARELADRRLFDAYLAQARAGRWSDRPGRKFDSLEAIRKAAEMLPSLALGESAVRELRDEAIGSLVLVDVRPDIRWPEDAPPGASVRHTAFDQRLERTARLDPDGEIVVRRLSDQAELLRLPGMWLDEHRTPHIQFSPDDEYLAASGQTADAGVRLRVWNVKDRTLLLDEAQDVWTFGYQYAFSADSRMMAIQRSARQVDIFELPSGKTIHQLAVSMLNCVAFHPNGRQLAVVTGSGGSEVSIVSLESGEVEYVLPHPQGVPHITFSEDGRLLSAACFDRNVYVWDTARLDQPWAVCRGHLSNAIASAFSADGALLMSTSYDGTTRLWNPRHGRQLVAVSGRGVKFSRDGRWLGFSDPAAGYGRFEVSTGSECRLLSTTPPHDSVVAAGFSPDGRFVAAASKASGVDVWEAATGSDVARFRGEQGTSSVSFTGDGQSLITASGYLDASIDRWSVDALAAGRMTDLLAGRESLARATSFPIEVAVSRNGRRMAASLAPDVIHAYDPADPTNPVRMKPVPSYSWFVAISPDGRRVAASEKRNPDVPVWDAESGDLLVHLRTTDSLGGLVSFSPDNRWLIVSEFGRFVFYDTQTWQECRRLPGAGPVCYGRLAFTPDMSLCAALSQHAVTLYDPATFQDVATLSTSQSEQLATGYPEGTGGLSFSPSGDQLAVGTMQGTVQLWDVKVIRARLKALGLDW